MSPRPNSFKIASAMIERAELPVQRNSTLNGRSAMAVAHAVQQEDVEAAGGSGAQHDFACATRASRSPVPSPYSVLSPVVWNVSQAMPAGSSIQDFSDFA